MKKTIFMLCAAMMSAVGAFAQATDTKSVDCDGSVTIKATPKTAYHFVKWTKGEADFPGNTAASIQIDNIKEAATYVAHFEANDYDFGEGVTFDQAEPFAVGTVVTLTATPTDECKEFERWSDGNTDNPRTITYDGTAPFKAVYKTKVFNVTVNADDASHGDVTINTL